MTPPPRPQPTLRLPARAGIGLRAEHFVDLLQARPSLGFIEAHSENYFGRGGKPLHHLLAARRHYPLSLHGVGLSIGSVDPLSDAHLRRLAELIDALQPALVSDHLCWSSVGGVYANDLLPLPYTEAALAHVVSRVAQVQERLGRQILLENVSSYLEYRQSAMPEWEFLNEVARRSGCGVLLDVNNIFVSAHNHGFDAQQYLGAIDIAAVQEIHLAGFTRKALPGGAEILIDTHSAAVADGVWDLYAAALRRFGALPTLIEWDADLPPLATLLAEAAKADAMLADTISAAELPISATADAVTAHHAGPAAPIPRPERVRVFDLLPLPALSHTEGAPSPASGRGDKSRRREKLSPSELPQYRHACPA